MCGRFREVLAVLRDWVAQTARGLRRTLTSQLTVH